MRSVLAPGRLSTGLSDKGAVVVWLGNQSDSVRFRGTSGRAVLGNSSPV